jgi:hypothetical protein
MEPKRSASKRAIADILTGAALGVALGVVAVIRDLTGKKSLVAETELEQTIADRRLPTDRQEAGAGEYALDERPPPALELRPGWLRVEQAELPRPTYWPAALAFGIILLLWGIVTSPLISVVGLAIFVLALARWIGDLRHGH